MWFMIKILNIIFSGSVYKKAEPFFVFEGMWLNKTIDQVFFFQIIFDKLKFKQLVGTGLIYILYIYKR